MGSTIWVIQGDTRSLKIFHITIQGLGLKFKGFRVGVGVQRLGCNQPTKTEPPKRLYRASLLYCWDNVDFQSVPSLFGTRM